VPSVNANGESQVNGVAATSATDAWFVGYTVPVGQHLTLTEHGNGTAWTVAPSPSHGTFDNSLASVAETATNNAWAVGITWLDNDDFATLVEHWNGSAWTVTPSP
jgi:hypothetical protein